MIGHIIRLLSELKQVIYDIYEVKKKLSGKKYIYIYSRVFFLFTIS